VVRPTGESMSRSLETAILRGRVGWPSEWAFLGASTVVFLVSIAALIYWSGSTPAGMSMSGDMPWAWLEAGSGSL
jgi:hypothetical protein